MARRTNEQKARDLAADLGVKVDVEADDAPRDYAVEIWTFDAHVNIDGAHTAIPSMEGWGLKSPAAVWAAVAEQLADATECPADCQCRDDEQAPAPAVPTIEELETELAAANASEDAALESGAGREVMRAARDRFVAAHNALQDARRADFRRERGYIEWAAPQQAAAPAPAAKEEIHSNDSTKKLARLAGVTTAAFNEQARDLGIPMHYSENRRCWAILNRAQAASLVEMIRDNPDKPV